MKYRTRLMNGVSFGRFRAPPEDDKGGGGGGDFDVAVLERPEIKEHVSKAVSTALEAAKTDWRAPWSTDEKVAEKLKRFDSPLTMVDSLDDLQSKWSDARTTRLPERNDDGTWKDPEAAKKHFAKWGVPEKIEDYKFTFAADYKPTPTVENSLPVLADLGLKIGLNAWQAQELAAGIVALDTNLLKAQIEDAERIEKDNIAQLTTAWGGKAQYEQNMQYVGAVIGRFAPKGTAEAVDGLRLEDGTLLKNHPAVAALLAGVGRMFSNDDTFLAFNNGDNAPANLDGLRKEKADLMDLRSNGVPADRARYQTKEVQDRLKTITKTIMEVEQRQRSSKK